MFLTATLNDPFGKEVPIPERYFDSFQPSQSTEYDSALNSKRPDDGLVKETSPPSNFLGICATIQSHDLRPRSVLPGL
jgi:hypothetical protein